MPTGSATGSATLRNLGANLALMAAAVALTLVVLEIGVRLFVDLEEHQPIGVRDVNLETRLSFLPNRERTYESTEFRFTVSTNRFGRRDVEWTDAMFADPDNLLVIGDSFVLGNAVEHESTIPSQLERIFAEAGQPVEAFNFGMPAAAPTQYKLNLEEALRLGIRARRVIVNIFIGNDFDPQHLPEAIEAREAGRRQRPGAHRPNPLVRALSHSTLFRFARMRIAHSPRLVGGMLWIGRLTGLNLYSTPAAYVFFRQQTPEQQQNFQRMLEVVGEIQAVCDANDRELYVSVYPNKIQVENREDLSSDTYDAEKPNRLILEYCRRNGVRCLDLLPVLAPVFERTREPLYYPIDRHPNERGYRLAAEAIAAFVMR